MFNNKDLQKGDELELVDRDNGESFGKAIINDLVEKKIKDLTKEELNNHGYDNLDAMVTSHKVYYGDMVGLDTDVKIIDFKLM